MVFIILAILLCSSCIAALSEKSMVYVADGEVKEWCVNMRDTYNIIPGQSFGSLPQHMHAKYLKAACHRFFCKPHPLAGKGVYKCEPLDVQVV